jgi:DnaJ domain
VRSTKNKARKHYDDDAAEHPPCDIELCLEEGRFKAPKSRNNNNREYYMLCSEHIQQFNKNYDYFEGRDEAYVQAFMKDAMFGHRPTWKMGKGPSFADIDVESGFRRFFDDIAVEVVASPPIPDTVKHALQLFQLAHPQTITSVKARYKQLVKQYHPDINKEAGSEEFFKKITIANQILTQHYA